MNKNNMMKTLDKLYLSFSILVLIATLLKVGSMISSAYTHNQFVEKAERIYSEIQKDKKQNNGFSPTMYLIGQDSSQPPCFEKWGDLSSNNTPCTDYKIDSYIFIKENLAFTVFSATLIFLLVALTLFFFRRWIIWLFRHSKNTI